MSNTASSLPYYLGISVIEIEKHIESLAGVDKTEGFTDNDLTSSLKNSGYIITQHEVFDYLLQNHTHIGTNMGSGNNVFTYGKSNSSKKKIAPEIKRDGIKLDSVIISKDKIEQIRAAISQQENEQTIFNDWGFSEVFEKGTAISLLFWGIPGTGKTLMAQAIADETGAELKIYGTADIQSSEPGGAERTIKEIFKSAKTNNKEGGKKVVLLFDECDSLLTDRNEVGVVLGAQVNTLLQELERYEGIVIFTTNRMGKLDPAVERRIAAKIEFTFPDRKERRAIWGRLIPKKAPINTDVNLDQLSKIPLAGGNIKNSVLNAARTAAYEKSKTIKMKHFVDAIEKEARSLQAFIAEYEAQTHHNLLGFVKNKDGSLELDTSTKPVVRSAEKQRVIDGKIIDGTVKNSKAKK